MPKVLMECGHAANAKTPDGQDVCVICVGINPGARTPAKVQPDLANRKARCSCGREVESSWDLAFFEYRGEGSRQWEHCASCGYTEEAHKLPGGKRGKFICGEFVPGEAKPVDGYYCGCYGWD